IKVKGSNIRTISGDGFKFSHNEIDFVKFSKHDGIDFNKTNEITLVGKLSINEYMGIRFPQVIIQDYDVEVVDNKVVSWNDIF
ncbi:MAG: hypothetical protein ACRDDY_13100, partial [Clostridium sp.]|uniref:hypothetical protein n=1 Tax=Clostridium sp. TaxID=1506 RepID=UPI003EE7DBE2